MCPMLLMTKAVKTKSSETIGKGVAVRTISAGEREKAGRKERFIQGNDRMRNIQRENDTD